MAQARQLEPTMACKCLNVRIRPQPEQSKPPDFLIARSGDSDYTLTYVGEHGLSIEHPQVTMRTRKMGQPTADPAHCIRHTTLTCLICETLAYRVQQLVPPNVDGQEGPLLPSSDWMEQETLKSSCGWIEVHRDCLVPSAVASLSASSAYSSAFHVAVPQHSTPASTPSVESAPEESPDQSQYDPPVGPFLANLKPLFPPAPFVPPHPVFTHLLSIAESHSQALRMEAENYIAAIIREKIAELQVAEDDLRRDVKCLWKQFVENTGRVEKDAGTTFKKGQDHSRGRQPITTGVPGTPLVSVRSFVPVASQAERVRSPVSSIPRVSSLSASLATSAFHHPAARRVEPAVAQPSRDSSASSTSSSSHPSPLGSVNGRSSSTEEDSPGPSPSANRESIIQPFRRKMDETQDTAVSFQYFSILEAEATRRRQRQATSERHGCTEEAKQDQEKAAEAGGDSKNAKMSGDKEVPAKESRTSEDRPRRSGGDTYAPAEITTPKSKRRVTFDIKVEADKMIFELEDASNGQEPTEAAPTLPFVDNTPTPQRHGRQRSGSHAGLPTSLSSLWPTSLPVHSGLRTRVDAEAGRMNGDPPDLVTTPISTSEEQEPDEADDIDEQEQEILNLVAAHTPSHRSAWKRNSKAWNAFVSRQYGKGAPGALIPEENEHDSERTPNDTDDSSDWDQPHGERWSLMVPGSLPITIGPLVRRREPLSLASYQPKSSLPDRAGTVVPSVANADGRHHSSASFRRASYAERDRTRHLDPGALDIAEDDEGSDEDLTQVNILDEARGRQRALKILEARTEGIHVVDVENIHSVVSHSIGDHVSFSAPAFSRSVVEDNVRSSITYAVIKQAPEVAKAECERTIWIMKQTLSGARVAKDEKKVVVVPHPPIRICGVDNEKLPLLLVLKNGGLGLADAAVDIKSQLEWPGERELLDVFVFPAASCSFIQPDSESIGHVVCVCCQAGSTVYTRLVLLGEEIVYVGGCELPIDDSAENSDARLVGLTCSASGVLSFMTSRGIWRAYQLSASLPSSFHAISLIEPLQLHRLAAFKQKRAGSPGISMVSLSTSLVILAATVGGDSRDVSLQLWDLRYGVLLASQTMSPSSTPTDAPPYLHLTRTDDGHVLLTVSPSLITGKSRGPARSTVYAIPYDRTLKSTLAAALGKSSTTEEWLLPKKSDIQLSALEENKATLVSAIETAISRKKPQQADDAFFTWIKKHDAAQPVSGHEFVKRIVNAILSPESKAGERYSPRIMHYLLEERLVNAAMVDGKLISRLREQGDWVSDFTNLMCCQLIRAAAKENIMLALDSVVDIPEDELISSVKSIIDTQRKREGGQEAMQIDSSEPWIPPLETCLSACISYDFSPASMRFAIRRHLSDARDLVVILKSLDGWLYGGTEDQMDVVFKSTATNADVTVDKHAGGSPPYPKIITFLQTLLDASCIALLQYQPSHEPLKQVLAQIQPEIDYIDRLEQLRGTLEPFAKAHARILREKAGGAPKESSAEAKKRRKRLAQQASLGIGLYRLEELVLDSVHAGVHEDKSGPLIQEILRLRGVQRTVSTVVPDEEGNIRDTVKQFCTLKLDCIFTTGGTGFGERDRTPEAISPLLERQAPGLVHLLLSSSLKHTPLAALSRPIAGTIGKTLVVTLPGSTKAVRENMDALLSHGVLDHALDLIKGGSGKAVHAILGSSHTPAQHTHAHHCQRNHHDCVSLKPRSALSHDPSAPAPGRLRVSPYRQIGLEEALEIIINEIQPLGVTTLPVTPSLAGHVLAEDVYAPQDVPQSKTTNVDGYAVRSSNSPGIFKVLTFFKHKLTDELPEGFIFRVNTGGPLPAGADSVIMVEDTELVSTSKDADGQDIEEEEVRTLVQVPPGDNVRQPGSDVRKGDLVLSSGEVINGVGGEIGTLTFVGRKEVKVFRKPIVAILSTGNELLDLQSPKPIHGDGWGGIWDTNRPSLQAVLQDMGYEVIDIGIVADDVDSHVRAISKGLETADILLTTGGTSMGASDLLKPVIERKFDGTIHFGRVAMRPGKPTAFASIPSKVAHQGRKFVFALPGNPAAALVTFHILV
ncbi:hypothetical protein ID866_7220, partial [Astraeus odoratus]